MRLLRSNHNFLLLWFAQMISLLGYWAVYTTLPFFIYKSTQSIGMTGLVFAIQVVPRLFVTPFLGTIVDRQDKKKLMLASNLLSIILLLPILLTGVQSLVWPVLIIRLFEICLNELYNPANDSLIPTVVEQDSLPAANAIDAVGENIARFLGPSLGGLMYATYGFSAVVTFNIVSYAVGCMFLIFVKKRTHNSSEFSPVEKTRKSTAGLFAEIRDGLSYIYSTPTLRHIFSLSFLALIGDSLFAVLLIIFLEDVIGSGVAGYSLIVTIRGIFGIIGGIIIGQLVHKLPLNRLYSIGLVGIGVALVGMVQSTSMIGILISVAAVGLPVMAWLVSQKTLLQIYAPSTYIGRIFALNSTMSATATVIGVTLANQLVQFTGIASLMHFGASLYILAGLAATLVMSEPRKVNLVEEPPET
jgi:predicted MFS family arabinose efflux permease